MKHTMRWIESLASAVLVTACAVPSDGANAESVGEINSELVAPITTTAFTEVVCSESSAIAFSVDVTLPSSVKPGATFPVSLVFHLAPPIIAPYSGNFDGGATFLATHATPADPALAFDAFHFAAGVAVPNFGSGSITLTAAHKVGHPVEVRLDDFDYTLVPDDTTRPPLVAHCVAPASSTGAIATIPIVNLPKTKEDCKRDGYKTRTDETGAVFKNQGACIQYLHGTD